MVSHECIGSCVEELTVCPKKLASLVAAESELSKMCERVAELEAKTKNATRKVADFELAVSTFDTKLREARAEERKDWAFAFDHLILLLRNDNFLIPGLKQAVLDLRHGPLPKDGLHARAGVYNKD